MAGTLCHHKLREALTSADAIMSGFSDPDPTGEVLTLLAFAGIKVQILTQPVVQKYKY